MVLFLHERPFHPINPFLPISESEADFAEISSEENLRDALDIDSFDFLNFVIGRHREFGVEIPESDYGKLTILDTVVAYIEARAG